MNYFVRRTWDLPQSQHTSEQEYAARKQLRREFLATMGLGAGCSVLSALTPGCQQATLEQLEAAGAVEIDASMYPAQRDGRFEYGRDETERDEAARFTNFYEFTASKSVYLHVDKFQPVPWTLEVTGLCAKPRTFDLDDLVKLAPLEERAYRHRCVETWAMCVPWTGYPLHKLLATVEPTAAAKYVRFETFNRPQEAQQMSSSRYPWPYSEGLTIHEAMNELTLLTTGIFGSPLLKQHGAPVRVVIPWKYGFKGIKSIVKIELTDQQPTTFWNSLNPHEYGFEANVDPGVPHPRWSQEWEWMLGSRDRHRSVKYNGYGDWVAKLYE
ncbi:MAG: protein-methionine-sulfoxide reductase catalytic subunit MsrP [Planctomycetaceae bacterium]|nr:protein-methionine-sulfoxide reductase catalytic subunit MsrP [Planctomycetaceae bacterium]